MRNTPFFLKLSPASSFGGTPFARPPFNGGSTAGTAVVSTATHAVASSGQTEAPTPELFSSPARSRRHGRAGGALWAGGSKDGDVKEKVRKRIRYRAFEVVALLLSLASSCVSFFALSWLVCHERRRTAPADQSYLPVTPVGSRSQGRRGAGST